MNAVAQHFRVDDVVPGTRKLSAIELRKHLAGTLGRRSPICFQPLDQPVVKSGANPLIDSVRLAWANHYPLQLSPDAIWLVIAQGFSHHINENAERFRGRLIAHQGKKPLLAQITSLAPENVAGAVASFSQQIRENTDPALYETLRCDFTTTTPVSRTAGELVLMDTYKVFFDYVMDFVCGIPSVILTGTPEDWKRIRERVEVLATFELEWWIRRLRPILDEFVNTSEGSPDAEFWKAIYKPGMATAFGCGHPIKAEVITGWIIDLFPYLGDSERRFPSTIFEKNRSGWTLPPDARGEPGGVSAASFPAGLCSVPVTVQVFRDPSCKLEFLGGLLGVSQDPQTLAVSPLIGWAVAQAKV